MFEASVTVVERGSAIESLMELDFCATHIIAYNCAQRFSPDPGPDPSVSNMSECVAAVTNLTSASSAPTTGGTIFYSLVPDGIFTQGPAR